MKLKTFILKIYQIKDYVADIFQWILQSFYFKNIFFTENLWGTASDI